MDNGSAPIVKCADLRRRFGEGETAVDAVRGVTLDFPKGAHLRRGRRRGSSNRARAPGCEDQCDRGAAI